MLQQLWSDETGVILSAEIVLVGTILVLGVLTGLTSLRDAVITELADVGGAISWLDQSYNYAGTRSHGTETMGVEYRDCHDYCDTADTDFHNSRCLVICTNAGGECRPNTNG